MQVRLVQAPQWRRPGTVTFDFCCRLRLKRLPGPLSSLKGSKKAWIGLCCGDSGQEQCEGPFRVRGPVATDELANAALLLSP